MNAPARAGNGEPHRIFHVSSRDNIRVLRDEILRLQGLEVDSILFSPEAIHRIQENHYDLVLIDVESNVRARSAQELCDDIKKVVPDQHVAFVCNYRVGIESDCPDEIIRAEFDPEAMVRGVQQALEKNQQNDELHPKAT